MERDVPPPGAGRPTRIQLERSFKLLNRSLEKFYQKRYSHAVELCGEALEQLLPEGTSPLCSPEEKGDLLLRTYAGVFAVQDAQGIAGVFTFFQSRRSRFQYRRGAPIPQRDWWQFIRIRREEAEEVLRFTRTAVNALERAAPLSRRHAGPAGGAAGPPLPEETS